VGQREAVMESDKVEGVDNGGGCGEEAGDTKRELTAAQKKREKLRQKKLAAQKEDEGGAGPSEPGTEEGEAVDKSKDTKKSGAAAKKGCKGT